MEPIAPSEATIAVFRAIVRAGFANAPTKALCAAAGWRLGKRLTRQPMDTVSGGRP